MTTPPLASPGSKSSRQRWRWIIILALTVLGAGGWGGYAMAIRNYDQACRSAQAEQRWADLEASARRWSRWAPKSAEPWVFLADAVQHQQRYVEAAECLSRIPPSRPQYLPSQLARAKLLFGPANRPFDAEQVCLEILQREPRVSEAQQFLIQFYTVTLQRTKLRNQIESAIGVGREPPDAYIYYFLIDSVKLGDGVPLNSLWLQSYPDNEILEVAGLLHGDDTIRDVDEAPLEEPSQALTEKEHKARELLKRFPHDPNLLAYLTDQELSRGHVDEVVGLLAQTLVETEVDPRFWRFKGWVHFIREEYDEAEQAYRKALSLHPLDWLTMHRLAEVLRIKGKTDEVARLESLVERSQQVRSHIRELKSAINPPPPLLLEIGRLARDAGDDLIATALAERLGSLDPPPGPARSRRSAPAARQVLE